MRVFYTDHGFLKKKKTAVRHCGEAQQFTIMETSLYRSSHKERIAGIMDGGKNARPKKKYWE